MSNEPDFRIGHPERTEALDILSEHFANGYLDIHEFDERTAQVAAATHRSHLTPLLADLPSAAPSTGALESTTARGAVQRQHDAELELAEVQRKGDLVKKVDAAIWGTAIVVMFVGIFFNVIPMWWMVFPIAGIGSWVARNVIGLEDDEENVYEELEYDKEEARRERLEQAMERRKELGQ